MVKLHPQEDQIIRASPTPSEAEAADRKLVRARAAGAKVSRSYDVMEINVSGETFALSR